MSADPAAGSTAILPIGVMNRYRGLPVREVKLSGVQETERVLQQLRELIVQEPKRPLDPDRIRQSLQALYATGRFADIQVEADRTPQDEVDLVFRARDNYFVGSVTVDGTPKRPTRAQLVNASRLQLGELATREKIDQALRGMKSLLTENGYYKAEITVKEEFHPETQQVDLHFQATPNQVARIGKISVTGDSGYTAAEVADIAKLHFLDTVSAQRLTRALQRLRKRYQKEERLEAQVAVTSRYHPDTNTLDYNFVIERGAMVDIDVQGAKLSHGKLKKLVPVYEEGTVDDDLLNEGVRNIREYFQTKGYFDVKVSWDKQQEPAQNRTHVIYSIKPGVRHKLEAIIIDGNRYFGRDALRERMQVRPASGILTQGLYSESMLNRDVEAIESLYLANGFEQVKVTREVDDNYMGEKGRMAVLIHVQEGPQTRVGAVRIEGNKHVPEAKIRELLTTTENQPFSDFNLAADRDSILNYYFNNGFPNVSVQHAAQPIPGGRPRMDVVFTIEEGRQVFVNRVLTSGLNYTKPYTVQRELQLHPGDPLNQLGMVDTQRRLYDLGIFNEVDAAVQNPDGLAESKNVLFEVREARRWTFTYGFGFEVQSGVSGNDVLAIDTAPAPGIHVPPGTIPPTNVLLVGQTPEGGTGFSPRVSFELTRINFRGRDHTIVFKGHAGNLQKRGLVSYEAPHWFDKDNWRLTYTALYDNSRDVRTFTSERLEGAVQGEQVLSRVTTLLYRFNYRRVKVDPNSLAISPELVPLLSRPVRIGMPSFTYIRDKRDDAIDPHRGNYTTFDTGIAAKAFGSAASFGRFLVQNSTYTPIKKKFVLARSTRIGVEEPFGDLPDESAIPLPERFFAGGATGHRGFALNQAGPRDLLTGFPLGGNAIFVNNIEMRFPPPELPYVGTNMSFVLFHDFGNVFESGQEMLSSFGRWRQPNRAACANETTHLQCGFNYMSQAVGTGIRYRTPLGPVRVDLSYNLNPPAFPFYVQCPAAHFPGQTEPCLSLAPNALIFQSGTLRHLNFFFSIGQSF
ncbi:MAG: POTRA domain-containing protein [Terriglobales bacterium]